MVSSGTEDWHGVEREEGGGRIFLHILLLSVMFLYPYIFIIYFAFILCVAVYGIVWLPEILLPF